MITKKVLVSNIIKTLGNLLVNTFGPIDNVYIDNLADVKHVTSTTLDWVGRKKKEQQIIAEQSQANVILVGPEVVYSDILRKQGKTLLVVKNPKMALATVGNAFFVQVEQPGIHPTAMIDPEAVIGKGVYIGPYVVIGKAEIGDYCRICSFVKIYDNVKMGHHCYIKDGSIIGGPGFGFEIDEEGNRFRFPQIGSVVMGNYVEIGANNCVDRGALSDTIIEDYTKSDNLCHIAHNDHIGKNVMLTAGVVFSGSVTVGDETWLAPGTVIRDGKSIGRNSMTGMGTVVVKNIPDHELWAGNPGVKFRDI